ncbi:MAG: DUF1700 domain-containing protein [Oscillospiraceae bacterium]|nr:DUF1700 domain-containing protein [Oscillospiraceae bacterium]
MNKQEFLDRLRQALSGLPQEDIDERLSFYGEMIDDRVEDGLTEQEATAEIGSAEDVAAQIVADTPLTKIVRERVRPKRRLRVWEIVLLALGSPIWLSLLIAAFAVGLSVYVVIWAVIVSLWAVDVSLIVSALGGVTVGVLQLSRGEPGLALVGAGIVLAGLSIFLFFGCKAATRGAAILTKKLAKGIKALFLRKENAA